MAKKNSTFLKKLVWNIFVLWVVMTNCVLTVEPKAMSTLAAGSTTSWYRMTTKAFSSLFNTITGGRASTSTDDGGDDVQGDFIQPSQWSDVQEAMETTKFKLENFFSEFFQSSESKSSQLQAKLEDIRKSLPSLEVDVEPFRNQISGWNWDSFSNVFLPSDASETQDDLGDEAHLPAECFMTTPEMIRYAGYPCEVHTATTADGYIVELHRIPFSPTKASNHFGTRRAQNRPVVFFQHGILADSSCWVANGPERSLPYILSDAGCDVWIGNVRGSTYSRMHTTLTTADEKFWRFTWQDMAEYDLPAMVEAALKVAGQEYLYYVGHSQGTLIAFAKLSEDPAFSKKVRMVFALGPVATLGNITSPVKSLTFLSPIVRLGLDTFGGAEILPKSPLSRMISAKLHKIHTSPNETFGKQVAYHGNNLMMFLCGVHPDHYYEDKLPVYFSHTPAGTSMHNLIHMSQLVETGKMQKWNYRSDKKNMAAYGEPEPPEYDVSNIRVPVAMFVGSEDQLADPVDSKMLAKKLRTLVHYRELVGWDHLDFLWGRSASVSVYKDVLEFIKGSEGVPSNNGRRPPAAREDL